MGPLKLSVAARDESRDGYMNNHNGKDNGQVDKQTYRIAATLDATRDFQATYVYDHTDLDNTPLPVTLYTPYGVATSRRPPILRRWVTPSGPPSPPVHPPAIPPRATRRQGSTSGNG